MSQSNGSTAAVIKGSIGNLQALEDQWEIRYFRAGVLNETPRLADGYNLRYQVYCIERGFLEAESYPDEQEFDKYDPYSIHLGAFNNDDVLVGTVRSVMPSELSVPLFEHCELTPEFQPLVSDLLAEGKVTEVSRLSVSRTYRRRASDGAYGVDESNIVPRKLTAEDEERAAFFAKQRAEQAGQAENAKAVETQDRRAGGGKNMSIVSLLYKAQYQVARKQGLTHFIVAMERSLQVLLKRFGFPFQRIGPQIDYYGPVSPYLLELDAFDKTVEKKSPELFAEFMEGLEDFHPPAMKLQQKLAAQQLHA